MRKIDYYNSESALAFPDVYLKPAYSDIRSRFGKDIDTSTILANNSPRLNIPIISAGMDTVTEDEMATEIALNGGIGEIHRNNTPEKQADLVRKVKEQMRKIEKNPPIASEDLTVFDALEILEKRKRGYVLLFKGKQFRGKISGIATTKDFLAGNLGTKLSKVATMVENKGGRKVITGNENTSLEEAAKIMKEKRIEKLPIINKKSEFIGIYTLKDYFHLKDYPNAALDKNGRLLVGAAIGVHEIDIERALILADAGVDFLFLDIAHGHSIYTEEMLKKLKGKEKLKTPIIVGNVATKEGVRFAYNVGADGIKVGIGPGFVCKTRNVAGTGVPQITALLEAKEALKNVRKAPPIISDGGIREPGDIAKAIVAGADSVMIGSSFAGTDKSPGDLVRLNDTLHKSVRGMASKGVLNDRKKISDSTTDEKAYSPEGRETFTPYRGSTINLIREYVGGLRSAMSYAGSHNIKELQKAKLIHISASGGVEQVRPLG